MKVLLTGASGFIGRYVVHALRQSGAQVVALGRRPIADVPFIEADLLDCPDFDAIARQAQATHLLHLAWYAEHGKFWDSPLNESWAVATARLGEAFCEAGGRHIVAAGTCAEYVWGGEGLLDEERSPIRPTSLYGQAKDVAHRALADICMQYQARLTWGRIFFPYGPGEPGQKLIPSLIDVFRGRRAPFAINAEARRDFLHAQDVAGGLLSLLGDARGDVYNICSGQPLRLHDLVVQLARLCGQDPDIVLRLSVARPGEPAIVAGLCERLKQTGWRQTLGLAEGLASMVREGV